MKPKPMTSLIFGSYSEPAYPGASKRVCDPEKATHWHVVVGGVQCALTTTNIGKHMPDFLRLAYDAGVRDEKIRIAELLGIG